MAGAAAAARPAAGAAAASNAAPSAGAVSPPGLRYSIDVRLDPDRHRLRGRETIVYKSGADSALHSIHLHAYPNAFRDHRTIYARQGERWGEDYEIRFSSPAQRGWMTIDSATVDGRPARLSLDETLARIDLDRPLLPGDSVTLSLRFEVQVPRPFDRFGRVGTSYSVAQWYPKVAVFDELGWHPDPYQYFSEFYGDFGTFDVAITLPDAYWVGATGTLREARGGDNEIPLLGSETPRDSVSVRITAATGDSLRGKWPERSLEIETDLAALGGEEPEPHSVNREKGAVLRVLRGVPVHYSYRWTDHAGVLKEADADGAPGPLHLLAARSDTLIVDTLRALARGWAPEDTLPPSLKTLRFHAERVHDFAWVASPHYVRGDTTWSGVSIRALVYRDDQKDWSRVKAMTVDAMKYFSERVGPYVWPSFTSAEAHMGGSAMEYPMLVMNDPESFSSWTELLDRSNAHELGHNWFYGMVANDERAHPWLDEGFTQYVEQEYDDWRYPRGQLKRRGLLPWLSPLTSFRDNETAYLERAWARDELPASTPADRQVGWPAYGTAAYSKPVCMLHTLRGMLGDSVFQDFLDEHYRRYAFKHPRPEDVVRVASEVSGQDLRAFFDAWVSTVDRAGFAIGGIRREESGDGHRSTVTVRRTEAMVLPVTVEARFADGSRQETRVLAKDRKTSAIFESRARLTQARVDPRHEIVEMNRLDNRHGPIPPVRLKPLFDVPTSDAITGLYGPTVWHGSAEGTRLGAWIDARYLASEEFPEGIRRDEAGVSVGTRDGSVAWRAGIARRSGRFGARAMARALVVRDAGMLRAGASLGNVAKAKGARHPFRSWSFALQYRDRYDLAPVDGRYWSLGRALHGTARFALETRGPRRLESAALEYRRGASAFRAPDDPEPDINYDRVSLEARQTLDLMPRGDWHLTWRVYAGTAFRRVPQELLFDAAEGSRLDALDRFYLNDGGPIVASGHYFNPGGGGLRGFRDRLALGKRILSLNLDASVPQSPVGFFADLGRVEAAGLGESPDDPGAAPRGAADLLGRALADAGLTYTIGPVALMAPIWVSRPESGEKPWRFRWLFTITSFKLPLP